METFGTTSIIVIINNASYVNCLLGSKRTGFMILINYGG